MLKDIINRETLLSQGPALYNAAHLTGRTEQYLQKHSNHKKNHTPIKELENSS